MKVKITQYKWAGEFGPFKIDIPCGECNVTEGVIKDVLEKEFSKEDVSFEIFPWLNNWWKIILKGGWHAPITLVNGKVISQGSVLDRGFLAYHIRKELIKGYSIPEKANIIFSKENCSFCTKAKELLKKYGIQYEERDIIKSSLFAQQLFYLTKQFFPRNKPVTTPQIWLDGKYVGGANDLENYLKS